MKKFFSAAIISSLLLTATMEKARSAEIVLITTGGIVATVVLYGLGYAGYGTFVLLGGLKKNVVLKDDVYRTSLDIVASRDLSLMNDDVHSFIEELKDAEPLLKNASDFEILNLAIDAANGL